MELKRHFSLKSVFISLYVFAFFCYIIFGLTPVDAQNFEIVSKLIIPSINMSSDVALLEMDENNSINTPDEIVGSVTKYKNKELLVGHSTTVFSNLQNVDLYDYLYYKNSFYQVKTIDMISKENVNMYEILKPADSETIILMTCAGKIYDNGDASHRLIIKAIKTN